MSSISHKRVALWQFFQKLFKSPPKTLSDRERKARYEAAIKDLQANFNNILEDASENIISKSVELSGTNFDFKYFIYRLVNESKTWPAMGRNNRIAVEIAQALVNGFGSHPNLVKMRIPHESKEVDVDNAFKDLSSWILTSLGPEIQRQYIKAALQEGKKILEVLKEPGLDISAVKAANVLSTDFENRLGSGQLRFPTARIMSRVIRHLFA